MPSIEIKPLRTLQEMREAVEVQKLFWGSDLESIVPAHMLYSLTEHGGHVLAAMDGGKMVGVLIGFIGTDMEESNRPAMANLLIASKRMVVLPEYRNHGIGYKLKLAQRDLAIKQGIRLITWTFDPLMSLNAYLNIHKLGVVCREYREDYYGSDSLYAAGGASDRLLAEWWVTNRRVEARINGHRMDLSLKQYLEGNATIVNPARFTDDGQTIPGDITTSVSSLGLLEIPVNFGEIVTSNQQLAWAWREHTRKVFRILLQEGFLVTDFVRETFEGHDRAFYLLSYNVGFDFRLN
jgi:predicted GNAT superfamily acetyltransferase